MPETDQHAEDRRDETDDRGLGEDEQEDATALRADDEHDRQVAGALHDRGRRRVVDDEDAGEQAEQAQAVEHRLERSDDALEALAAQRRAG